MQLRIYYLCIFGRRRTTSNFRFPGEGGAAAGKYCFPGKNVRNFVGKSFRQVVNENGGASRISRTLVLIFVFPLLPAVGSKRPIIARYRFRFSNEKKGKANTPSPLFPGGVVRFANFSRVRSTRRDYNLRPMVYKTRSG